MVVRSYRDSQKTNGGYSAFMHENVNISPRGEFYAPAPILKILSFVIFLFSFSHSAKASFVEEAAMCPGSQN